MTADLMFGPGAPRPIGGRSVVTSCKRIFSKSAEPCVS